MRNSIKSLFFLAFFYLLLVSNSAYSQVNFQSDAPYAVLMDFQTGDILYQKNADVKIGPSSMTKVLTSYIVFDYIKKGRISLDDTFAVSANARSMEGSRMFIEQGSNVRLEDLLRGIIIQSGNDATTCVAEGLSGSEEAFAEEMNLYAQKLGMKNSNFKNSNGLPHPEHFASVKDLAILARSLITNFPEYYHYYSETEFTYNKIKQMNRNVLLYRPNLGADGLKTGHTASAGYGIISSAIQKGRRVIAVVNGLKTMRDRITSAEKLLWYGFNQFQNLRLYNQDEVIDTAKVWGGKVKELPLSSNVPVDILLKKSEKFRTNYKLEAQYKQPLTAPITKGDKIGNLVLYADGSKVKEWPLFASSDIEEASFFEKISEKLSYFLGKIL
ncbi:MAG: D-alanyl-D-alanine carboxypeptidase family protein [Rickettsiales bacterium]|nr:D-alanyl-D-alanine carboxypeptidase family protein [Rickettsiales bacterium]